MITQEEQTRALIATSFDAERVRKRRVLLAGLGNIGSFAALLLAPVVGFIRLIDRDKIESHNTINQFYGPQHIGQNKADVIGDQIEQFAPHLQVERRVADLEDVPWEDFADVDVVMSGLDSLRGRQSVSEKVGPLQIPYIDSAVGDPAIIRVQILLPGEACLECSWGPAQYRQLSTEYPCLPGAAAQAARTMAPSCAGAAAAATMVAQCMKLFGDDPPQHSYEINGDLLAGRVVASMRRLNQRCRFPHAPAPHLIPIARSFDEATFADLLAAVPADFLQMQVQFEFRRGLLDEGLFGPTTIASPEQLSQISHRQLAECRMTLRDRVVIRAEGQDQTAHVCFHSAQRSLP